MVYWEKAVFFLVTLNFVSSVQQYSTLHSTSWLLKDRISKAWIIMKIFLNFFALPTYLNIEFK